MSAVTDLDRLIAWAKEQIGTAEAPRGSNNVIYNTDYYGRPVNGDAFPWCCVFVWDGFRICGISPLFVGGEMTAYCPYVMSWAQSHGQWVTDGYRAGDLPLFDWNGDGVADHIGICVKVYGTAMTTIEGNVDSAVREMTRSTVNVIGAFRPRWGEELPDPPASDLTEVYVVQPGDTLSQIAERLGVDMLELARINGISNINLIFAGQELKIPGSVSDSDTDADDGFFLHEAEVLLPVLTSGAAGQAVKALQVLLILRGHKVGSAGVDGELGPDTLKALKAFQKAVGLSPTGETDGPTWEQLIG